MKEKVLKIKIPEGYEIDKEKSTFEKIVFKLKPREDNYKDVYKKLFYRKRIYYWDDNGNIISTRYTTCSYEDLNNCTSEKQAKKLLAINQLMNVAKYLNDGWQPDWNNENEKKYTIIFDKNNKIIVTNWCITANKCLVYFKTEELAQKAIDILGEETIKLALSTDW